VLPALLSLIAPPACLACRRPPAPGDILCRDCKLTTPWMTGDLCPRCGLPWPCGRRCPAADLAFDRAWAPVAYAGPVRDLVNALKERGALVVAQLMAAQIVATAPPGLLDDGVVVPVPADPLRRRLRGLDHAGRLAAELAARCDLEAELVLRRRPARRQAGSTRRRRLAGDRTNVEPRMASAPSVVVLVDDVHTTGATLDACARALRSAGTREVRAVTYARTLPASGGGSTV
jgi:predicted amidophosphoribosyltransferase